MKLWIAIAALLLPVAGFACESGARRYCEEQMLRLITYRAQAITGAFGEFSDDMPRELRVRFVRMRDPDYAKLPGHINYDAEHETLLLTRSAVDAAVPIPLGWAVNYWPYYEQERYREAFPIIEAIDNALWSAYLQSAARKRGLSWPHPDCSSVEVERRLPCEMVVTGIARFVKVRTPLHFNENRLDRMWPESFSTFNRRGRSYQDSDYRDVTRYGGLALVRPLINEFGVPQVLAYVAQVPFVIEQNNVRISALNYQERARDALRAARSAPAPHQPPVLIAQAPGSDNQLDEEPRRRSLEQVNPAIRSRRDREFEGQMDRPRFPLR